MPGNHWTRDEEETLEQLIRSGENAQTAAAVLGKSIHAIYEKARRMGLSVSVTKVVASTLTPIQIPPELPTSEEALKMLAGALQTATQPGLDKVEVLRLQVLATLARNYDHLLANYVRYRQIETKLMELEHKYAQLAEKTKDDAPKSNSTEMAQPTTK